MSRAEGKPVRLGRALDGYLRRTGLAERIDEARVVPEWPERVGPAIADVTTPIRVSDGVLVVAVRSSAWLMELKMMEREILRRLNRIGDGGERRSKIRKIRFVMASTGSP